jgi:hypothetical protein
MAEPAGTLLSMAELRGVLRGMSLALAVRQVSRSKGDELAATVLMAVADENAACRDNAMFHLASFAKLRSMRPLSAAASLHSCLQKASCRCSLPLCRRNKLLIRPHKLVAH